MRRTKNTILFKEKSPTARHMQQSFQKNDERSDRGLAPQLWRAAPDLNLAREVPVMEWALIPFLGVAQHHVEHTQMGRPTYAGSC